MENILVANFSFKNQKEVNEAVMAIFLLTNKIKLKNADYLHT